MIKAIVILALLIFLTACTREDSETASGEQDGDKATTESVIVLEQHISKEGVHKYLREVGVIDEKSKIISTEWMDTEKQWFVITEQGKHEDGEPKMGHWFVDSEGKDWSGSFCRH